PKCHSRRRTPVWESQSRTMLPPGGGPPLAIITPLVVTRQFPFGLKAAAVTSSLCASRSVLPLLASNRSACWPAMRSDRSPILDGAIRVIGKPSLPSSATAEPDATFQPRPLAGTPDADHRTICCDRNVLQPFGAPGMISWIVMEWEATFPPDRLPREGRAPLRIALGAAQSL